VLLYPVSVQGDSAAGEIEAAIAELNASGLVDLIVVARGGGSLEDLAAFNSEQVARAIALSGLPVVSAVGHETDFTIADFVADLRAPTPSAAAELITEAQHKIAEHLATLEHRLERAARFQLLKARQQMTRLPVSRAESRVGALLRRLSQRLDELVLLQEAAITGKIRRQQNRVVALAAAVLRHDPRQALAQARERLQACVTRMDRSLYRTVQRGVVHRGALDARLIALSPLAVLDRGYALVLGDDGRLIRSAEQVSAGDRVRTRLADGSFTSRVEATEKSESAKRKGKSSRSR
jgi:exodeoxyribonuclease VII large subunit